jgi:hypothetical protein
VLKVTAILELLLSAIVLPVIAEAEPIIYFFSGDLDAPL